jgi:hypothetical protein
MASGWLCRRAMRFCSVGRRVPHARESEAGEVGCVAGGEFGDAMVAQRQSDPGVKDDAPSWLSECRTRLGRWN